MAARTRRIAHDANTRAKIKTSQIVNRLTNHLLGEVELSATQIRAAEILLNKTLPNLSAVEVDATVEDRRSVSEYSTAEIIAAIEAARSGVAGETERPEQPSSVH